MLLTKKKLILEKDDPPNIQTIKHLGKKYIEIIGHMSDGGILENAVDYQKVKKEIPRDNH